MKTEQENIDELLVKYWGGSASTSEKLFLLDWLKETEANREYFIRTHDLWISTKILNDFDLKTEIGLDKFRQRVLDHTKKKGNRKKLIARWSQIAAILIIAVLSGILLYQNSGVSNQQLVANQIIMPEGNKGKVELPDGTFVWLNSGSKLIYPETFTNKNREVAIEGEGYFEVFHDSKHPFIVKAGDISVQVLGTKFNVQNYATRKSVDVTLLEGSVAIGLKEQNNSIILKPNEKYSFEKSSNSGLVKQTNAGMSTIWTKKRITFENKKLSDIIPYLEGWYGVEVKCDKALAESTHLSFTIREDSLQDLLQSIHYISDLKFETKDNTVYILK